MAQVVGIARMAFASTCFYLTTCMLAWLAGVSRWGGHLDFTGLVGPPPTVATHWAVMVAFCLGCTDPVAAMWSGTPPPWLMLDSGHLGSGATAHGSHGWSFGLKVGSLLEQQWLHGV